MEAQYDFQNTGANIENTPKRPSFLTVICIITWVGCAFAIIGGIIGYFTTKVQCQNLDSFSAYGSFMGQDMQEMMEVACQNLEVTTTINILCGIICLVGSILMWNLKKTGFYIYTVAEIAPPVSTFFLGAGGMFGAASGIIAMVIAIVWIVLYAVNLKHMVK